MSSNPHDGSRPTIVLVHSPFAESAMVRTTQAPWCLGVSAWLLPPTKRAPARPWDRQTGSPGRRSRVRVGSAKGCRRPLAHRPSAARQIRPGPPPLSPTSPPCTHLTSGYLRRRPLASSGANSKARHPSPGCVLLRTTSLCAPGSPANSALALPAGAARRDARTATSRLA
jgi:hypothetical protein